MPLPPCEGTQKEGNHGSVVKDLTAMQEMQEMQFRSLNWEDPLEKKMATYSSILTWEISWTEEPSTHHLGRNQPQHPCFHPGEPVLASGPAPHITEWI